MVESRKIVRREPEGVIRHAMPHVVALQELDGAVDGQRFADALAMRCFYVEARAKGAKGFGNTLLSRYPGNVVRFGAWLRASIRCGEPADFKDAVVVGSVGGVVRHRDWVDRRSRWRKPGRLRRWPRESSRIPKPLAFATRCVLNVLSHSCVGRQRTRREAQVILGTDVSGVIDVVADDVRDFSVGDEVYSMVRFPSGLAGDSRAYAEYVSVPASEVALKPSRIDHVHAAGAPMSLLTAWQFMIELGHNEPNPLQPNRHEPVPLSGRTVLINGAAGGVGHFAVQLAKWKGARVIAVSSGAHESFLRELGADDFIDYTRSPARRAARASDVFSG